MKASSRILLVEDNPDHRELTLMTLEENNVRNEIVVANDGIEALEYLFGTGRHEGRDPRDVPALVLLDLKLPKLGGIEVLRRIRDDERTRFVPVVILTSSSEEEDILASLKNGANSYVRKPVDFGLFVEQVRRLQVYWLLVHEPQLGG
ncbi:response regulator [Caenimonas aquaedulcis]|uniref:Response regulator n=1 Tax=Caenimonas aquaedulcis TaxID=2793270 RepID=A0A931H1F7_9BURK|nr:response regulator [Caenimonas aquaedulcis]MBG9386797.1 response regulator [Caenimonas aquaedulcis]